MRWPAYASQIVGFTLVTAALIIYPLAAEKSGATVTDAAVLLGLGHAYLLGSISFHLTHREGNKHKITEDS